MTSQRVTAHAQTTSLQQTWQVLGINWQPSSDQHPTKLLRNTVYYTVLIIMLPIKP
jgi:hypothetical protein